MNSAQEGEVATRSAERGRFLAGVRARLGGPYCTPPRTGRCTDCSGLVCEEYQRATNRAVSCGSHELYRDLETIAVADLLPGDLLFYDTGGRRSGNRASHVGIAIGEGRAIHAMNERQGIIETAAALPYWRQRFLGARRLPFANPPPPPAAPPKLAQPIDGQTPFRQTGDPGQARMCEILAGTPLAVDCAAIHAACGGLAALPVAQSWLESRYGQDATARATRNPLGLLDYSGRQPVRWIGDLPLCVFPTWAAAFAEWARRASDPSYKEGVYLPHDMTLEQFIVTYVAGPGCWSSRGAACANGESWASCQRYLSETVARLNRYHGRDDPDPPASRPPPPASVVPLRRAIIPAGNPNRPGTRIAPAWITIHETGNPRSGANAEQHRDFTHREEGGPERVSFHYVVDDREAILLLEHDEMAWHAGDGCDDPATDTGCFRSIAIETCVNGDGDWEQAKRHLVSLVRHILRADARFSPQRIAQHHRWSGKDCPQRIRAEGSWERLLHDIEER